MHIKRWFTILLLLLLAATPSAIASSSRGSQPAQPKPWRATIYWQNDGTFVKPNHSTDRHYTDGVELSFTSKPQWARNLIAHLPLAENFNAERAAVGFSLGQLIFTPDNTQAAYAIPNDRPYAGYLFTSAYFQRSNKNTFDQLTVELGVVGPDALGEQVQNTVHRIRNFNTAKGWDHQLHNEVTGQIYLRRKWRFNLPRFEIAGQPIDSQIIPRAEIDLGTVYRQLVAGTLIRLGVNLPDDFGPGQLHDEADFTGRPPQGLSAYFFTGVKGFAVEHNLFLQGNTFRNSLSVDAKPLVGQVQAGLALACHWQNWSANLVYGQTFSTKQFDGQYGTDAFGSITLAVVGRF